MERAQDHAGELLNDGKPNLVRAYGRNNAHPASVTGTTFGFGL